VTSQEAKLILQLYRPDTGDETDSQVAEALELARRDPELGLWFERTCAFHAALRGKLRDIPVPPGLAEAILAGVPAPGRNAAPNPPVATLRRQPDGSDELSKSMPGNKIVFGPWWQHRGWFAAAAILVLLGVALFWLQPRPNDGFTDYRSRMVRTAIRQYRMDISTRDLSRVRQYLHSRGAPSDFTLTNGLEKLTVRGGVFSRWRDHPVAMVCFDRGDRQMVFLFVVDRGALKDPPPVRRQTARVNTLLTASWTEGGETYLLAGPEDSAVLRGKGSK
jgi:hypothetical protein